MTHRLVKTSKQTFSQIAINSWQDDEVQDEEEDDEPQGDKTNATSKSEVQLEWHALSEGLDLSSCFQPYRRGRSCDVLTV